MGDDNPGSERDGDLDPLPSDWYPTYLGLDPRNGEPMDLPERYGKRE